MLDEPSGSAMSVMKQRSILILSNGKALQVAQRGIAGAEIVERDADPDGAKVVQNGERRLVVADEDGLGDLELQPARGEAGCGQRRHHLQRQRAAPELNRRDVDREPDIAGPAHRFLAGRWSAPTRRAG